jgi:hypothetical protein
MKVDVFGSLKNCSLCRAYAGRNKDGALSVKPGIEPEVIRLLKAEGIGYAFHDLDADPKGYAAAKKALKITGAIKDFPALYASDAAGKVRGIFLVKSGVVSPFTAARVAAMAKASCPGCCDTGCAETPAPAKKVCKTCGQLLPLILLPLAFSLILTGCVWTGGSYTASDGTKVKGNRAAFLYPFKLGNAELVAPAPAGATPGKFAIKSYETSGGAAELVPVIDASGRIVSYVVKGAVQGAAATVIP